MSAADGTARAASDDLEQAAAFTLSFFAEQYRPALRFCGSRSGRDTDKIRATGLTPAGADGSVWFAEARLVLVCRKVSAQDIDPERFHDPAIGGRYPQKDYHRMYAGEIMQCLQKG